MTNYPTNLSDSQWQVIKEYLNNRRKRKYDLRQIVDGILYLVKTGCQWRMLPSDFPKWQLVYYYFAAWRKDGTIDYIHESLVETIRVKAGKKEEPTVGILDSQSVKTTDVSCSETGFDAGKRIKGRKRSIIVDTLGLILCVAVHSAAIQDRNGGLPVIEKLKEKWNRIVKIFADSGYNGTLIEKVKEKCGYVLEIVKKQEATEFKVLPKRWIVERTIAWINNSRRMAKDYERYTDTSEAMIQLAAIRIMLNRF
jgi:putative transposase